MANRGSLNPVKSQIAGFIQVYREDLENQSFLHFS